MHTYPQDALFADRTAEPTGGVPSMTDADIIQAYQWWLNRAPDTGGASGELDSERQNALKYSAAGIERQIALRAGNTPASGVRGDENLPALTVPAPHVANVITMGPAAIVPGNSGGFLAPTTGPTGLMYANPGMVPFQAPYGPPAAAPAAPSVFGLSLSTVAILAAVAGAGLYFAMRR